MGLLLIVIAIFLVLGGLPAWGYSRKWGYGPSGAAGVILLIVLVLVFANYIPRGF